MRDPQAVISRVRQGAAPPGWRVFIKKRGAVGAFFTGTRGDPDPLLVFTPEGAVEYVSEKKPLAVVAFDDLSEVKLRARASTTSDSMQAHLHVWLDLRYLSGKEIKWQPASFKNDLDVIQHFIEAYGTRKALGRSGNT